jgi:hypothetical protein
MLSQVNLWAERVGMVFDLVLLLRIMMLRLQRVYLFITLFALLSLFYDGVGLVLGMESEEFSRVVILSRFLYAIVFPLAIWDLFEEAKPLVEKVRRLAMTRMISSLIFISLWGLLIAAFTGDDGDQTHYLMRLAFVIWTGSVAAALAFLWVMRRGVKANQWQLPRNTAVWFRYFQWMLVVEAASCILDLLLPSIKAMGGQTATLAEPIAQTSEPVLQVCVMVLTTWCVLKLRAVPSDTSDVPAKVNP